MVMFHSRSPCEFVFVWVAFFHLTRFNFVMVMVMEIALFSCEISGVDICLDRSLFDLEYADDFVPLGEDSSKLHVFRSSGL